MPRGLLLKTNGSAVSVDIPATAQELVTVWKSADFPTGVFLHKMLHLSKHIAGLTSATGNGTVSLSLLRGNDNKGHAIGNCNFHEIPKALDTQLFYGDLLMILTIDGSTIINLSQSQYNALLDADISEAMTTLPRNNSRGSSSDASPLGKVVRGKKTTSRKKKRQVAESPEAMDMSY